MKELEPIKTILTIKHRMELLMGIIHRKAEDIFDNKLNYNSLEEGRDREICKPVFEIIDFYKDYYSCKLGRELSNLFSFNIEYFRYAKGELIAKFREIENLLVQREDMYRPVGIRSELNFLLPVYTEIRFKLDDLKREVIDEFSPQIKDIEKRINELETLRPQRINSIPAKYYAFYHWILIETGKAKSWDRNENGKYPKNEIMTYAKNEYKLKNSQGFYREFIGMDISNKVAIVRSLNDKYYKKKLIEISGNNANIISLLKDYPTL